MRTQFKVEHEDGQLGVAMVLDTEEAPDTVETWAEVQRLVTHAYAEMMRRVAEHYKKAIRNE